MEQINGCNSFYVPELGWWVLLSAVKILIEPFDICFRSLEGQSTAIAEQNDRIKSLAQDLKEAVQISGPLNTVDMLLWLVIVRLLPASLLQAVYLLSRRVQ